MDKKYLIISCDTIKGIEENLVKFQISHTAIFWADIFSGAREIKGKNKQIGLHQIKKLLPS